MLSYSKAGMEDAIIRAKANMRGHVGSSGLGDTAGSQRGGIREHKFGDTFKSNPVLTQNRTGQSAQGSLKKPVAKAASAAGPIASEILSSAVQADEDGDAGASRRLAAKFVRNAGGMHDKAPARTSMLMLRPYLAGAAFLVILAGGLTGYFLKSGASTGWSPAGSAYAAAALDDPSDAPAIRHEPGKPAAAGTASPAPLRADSWAAAVETFRLLSAGLAAAPQDKAVKPEHEHLLERLAAWRSANAPR